MMSRLHGGRDVRGVAALFGTLLLAGCAAAAEETPAAVESAAPVVTAATPEDAGRYIALVGGCNDCHTEGYLESMGEVPESSWLSGSVVGFRGPWGTTYPANLRLSVVNMTEDQWVETLRTRKGLPPMPWPNVNQMTEADARALYRYITSLGPTGSPAPTNLAPNVEPTTPWFDFVPKNLPVVAAGG